MFFSTRKSVHIHPLAKRYKPVKNCKTLFLRLFVKNMDQRIFGASVAQLRQIMYSAVTLCTVTLLRHSFRAVVRHNAFAVCPPLRHKVSAIDYMGWKMNRIHFSQFRALPYNSISDAILSGRTDHCHAPNLDMAPVLALKSKIRKRAAETEEPSSTILHSVMRAFPFDSAGELPTTDALLRTIRRQRPAVPMNSNNAYGVKSRLSVYRRNTRKTSPSISAYVNSSLSPFFLL